MVETHQVKQRAQKANAAAKKAAPTNKANDESIKNIAALSDKQIRNESWTRVRQLIYIAVCVLVTIGFYLLWNRKEQCALLNRHHLNPTV